eukprot:1137558-Pelagomonas_calceolata.AAC.1
MHHISMSASNDLLLTEALAGGDTLANVEARAQRTADLYAPDAVLLATVSPLVRVGRKDIVDYMRFFVSLSEYSTHLDIVTL